MSAQTCELLMLAAIAAHTQNPLTPDLAFRKFDGRTLVALHAVQCATTIVQEMALPEELRDLGFQVLLFHDVKKYTTAGYPVSLSEPARHLVEEMTFGSTEEETERIWQCSPECRLFMLFAKLGNLWDDAAWMDHEARVRYLAYVLRLADVVEQEQGELGKQLRIIPVIRCLCKFRPA